jgi:hypothetical protein
VTHAFGWVHLGPHSRGVSAGFEAKRVRRNSSLFAGFRPGRGRNRGDGSAPDPLPGHVIHESSVALWSWSLPEGAVRKDGARRGCLPAACPSTHCCVGGDAIVHPQEGSRRSGAGAACALRATLGCSRQLHRDTGRASSIDVAGRSCLKMARRERASYGCSRSRRYTGGGARPRAERRQSIRRDR